MAPLDRCPAGHPYDVTVTKWHDGHCYGPAREHCRCRGPYFHRGCSVCRRAATYRWRGDDPEGTRRLYGVGPATLMLRSLVRLGHSVPDLVAASDLPAVMVSKLTHPPEDKKWISPLTASRVQAAFDKLCMTVGRPCAARTIAIRAGWRLPLELDEEEIRWRSK